MQDIRKVIFALKCIVEAKGNVVRGLASREGHRRYVESRNIELPEGFGRDDGYGDNGDGDDGDDGDNGYLHNDSKRALDEYWGKVRADGEQQVDTVED